MSKADKMIIAACIGVLAFYFLRMTNQPVPPVGEPGTEVVAGTDTATVPTPAVTGETPPVETPEVVEAPAVAVPAEFADLPEPTLVTLANDDAQVTIDPTLGGLTDIIMIHHQAELDKPDLVSLNSGEEPFLGILSNADLNFSTAKVEQSESGDAKVITVSRAILGEPFVLQQTWKVSTSESHRITYAVTLQNTGEVRSALPPMRLNLGTMGPLSEAGGFMGSSGIDQRIDVREMGEDPDWYPSNKIAKLKPKKRAEIADMPVDWVAVQNKYFALITDHDEPMTDVWLDTLPEKRGEGGKLIHPELITASVPLAGDPLGPGESRSWEYDVYAGPKSYKGLKSLGGDKEALMHFDLFMIFHFKLMEWVSLFILWMIRMLQGLIGNYGIAIIGTTVAIRMTFWPITHQSTLMSRKMQKIQPQIKELNEKYKDDPQKKSLKMMEIYRENNINLAAGCLPVLLQIPVFFALFNVLRSTIELRHQPFFGWVHDLAAPDTVAHVLGFPVNPLAAVWGVSMFFQQKCMPQSADPMQRRMMMFMTMGMLVFLYNMPSGLVLYWTVSNCLSILQYRVTRTTDDSSGAGAKQTAAAA